MAKRVRPAKRPVGSPRRRGTRSAAPAQKAEPQSGARPAEAAFVGPSAPLRPAADAIALFQRAMEALQRHEYAAGAAAFREVVERFPSERALLDRARVYIDLCERELRKRPVQPQTIEERLTAATAALNNADTSGAERLVRAVLAEDARQDLALYLLAVIESRRGDAEAALTRLADAIAASPDASAQARFDPDFEWLRDTDWFKRLTNGRNHTETGPRRGRRTR